MVLHFVVVKLAPASTFCLTALCWFYFIFFWVFLFFLFSSVWQQLTLWAAVWIQPLMHFSETNTFIDFPCLSFCTSHSLSVFSSSLSVLKVSSHSEPSSQSLSLQQPAQQQPPPPPPPPPHPQYGLPVPESRDKQLCFSDFEDLSASFRSLYKCVFEQSFSQQGGCRRSFRGLVYICSCVPVQHLNWHVFIENTTTCKPLCQASCA